MGLSRRLFTKEFKLAAVRRLEEGVSIGEVARGLEVNPHVLHRWRREFRQGPGNAFPGFGKRRWDAGQAGAKDRPADLGNRFFKGLLATHRGTADVAGIDWKAAIYGNIQEQVRRETGMSIAEMCALAELSRAGYDRFLTTPAAGGKDIDLRDAIQRIALEFS